MAPELPDPAATDPAATDPADTERAGTSSTEPVHDRAPDAAGPTPAVADSAGGESAGGESAGGDSAGTVRTDPAYDEAGPPQGGEDGRSDAEAAAAEHPPPDPRRQERMRRLVILAVAAVILIAVAVVVAFGYFHAEANGPVSNQAFVDTGSTAAVEGEVTAAIKTVYSYDYRTLDANRAAAKAVTTGQFAQDFDKVFDAVGQLAPKEQAVMTTAVPAAGVMELHGDRARLLMMVDQNGTKGGSQPIGGASARLLVTAQRVDGQWKIAEVTPE